MRASLPSFPQALPVFPNSLERLTMLIADLPRFLCQSPELFCLVPGRLGRLCLLTVLLWRDVVVWHGLSVLDSTAEPMFSTGHQPLDASSGCGWTVHR